jgi:hypothetical protein
MNRTERRNRDWLLPLGLLALSVVVRRASLPVLLARAELLGLGV